MIPNPSANPNGASRAAATGQADDTTVYPAGAGDLGTLGAYSIGVNPRIIGG